MNRSPRTSVERFENLSPSEHCKKVLLFGKTGQGKSTTANMLVSGSLLPNPLFTMGDGLKGVTEMCEGHTGRNYFVFDTVGLGEDASNHSVDEGVDAIEQIRRFLESTQGEYSHILFVKSADRFDQLDKEVFEIFKDIFKGAEPAFGVVVTKCNNPTKWRADNEKILKEKYGTAIPPERYVYVDFPPLNEDEDLEDLYMRKRTKSLDVLDAFLNSSFESNKFKYYKPHYVGASPPEQLNISKRVFFKILQDGWEYVKQFVSRPKDYAEKALAFFSGALGALGVGVTSKVRDMLTRPESIQKLLLGIVPEGKVLKLLL